MTFSLKVSRFQSYWDEWDFIFQGVNNKLKNSHCHLKEFRNVMFFVCAVNKVFTPFTPVPNISLTALKKNYSTFLSFVCLFILFFLLFCQLLFLSVFVLVNIQYMKILMRKVYGIKTTILEILSIKTISVRAKKHLKRCWLMPIVINNTF